MDISALSNLMVKITEDRDEIAFSNLFDILAPKTKTKINEEDIRDFLYNDSESDKLKRDEIIDQVNRINQELTADQRKIIKMNFFESKSHKKIAQELEIPLGTVKSKIRHILTKLQSII